MLSKLLPSFLKFNHRKNLIDIQIDEYKNILYGISISVEVESINETIIDVFDLGILGNKF